MTRDYTITTAEPDEWDAVLQRCLTYDVYHRCAYHKLAEKLGEGTAVLFVHESEGATVAVPLLLREIPFTSSTEGRKLCDATSVYGYPGPVASGAELTESVLVDFSSFLQQKLREAKVVSAFSRLHPLMSFQKELLEPIGQVLEVGKTVAIDLRMPVDEQWQQYRPNHQRDIGSARDAGVHCLHDQRWDYLKSFIDLYYETMRRVGAVEYYFFDQSYFDYLSDELGENAHLFVALQDGVVICGGVFTVCGSIIQYHLGGTRSEYLHLSPIKLLFDSVRQWGGTIGAEHFHLGGGVGGKCDGLFRFKAGFSDDIHPFCIWRSVILPEVYNELVAINADNNKSLGLEVADADFFPMYRAPVR